MTPLPGEASLEPELQAPAPRKLGFRLGTQLTRLLLAVLFFALLAGVWALVAVEQRNTELLFRKGRTTVARVSGKQKYSGRSTDYDVEYTFTVDASPYTGSEHVEREEYYHTKVGDRLTVTYLPSDPSIEQVGKVDASTLAAMRQVELVVLGFLTPMLLGFAWYCERYFRRQLRLLRYGTAVRAEILEWSEGTGTRMPRHFITVAYDAPGSGRITTTLMVDASLGRKLVQQPTATVLYDPQKPQESNFYLALSPRVPKAPKTDLPQHSAAGV